MASDFFYQYFLKPILFREGFNPVNTTVYAVLLVLISLYLVYPALKKLKVKIDGKLAVGISSFILLGTTIRVLVDSGFLPYNIFLITPMIYILIFTTTFASLLLSTFLQKKIKIEYHKILFSIGIILSFPLILFLKFQNFYGSSLVFLFFIPWLLFFYLLKKWPISNRVVAAVHQFDATTTSVTIYFFPQFLEQHFIPAFFISFIHPFSFVFIKLLGIVVALFLIDKYSKNRDRSNFLKLILGVLGASTGLRDFLALLVLG